MRAAPIEDIPDVPATAQEQVNFRFPMRLRFVATADRWRVESGGGFKYCSHVWDVMLPPRCSFFVDGGVFLCLGKSQASCGFKAGWCVYVLRGGVTVPDRLCLSWCSIHLRVRCGSVLVDLAGEVLTQTF